VSRARSARLAHRSSTSGWGAGGSTTGRPAGNRTARLLAHPAVDPRDEQGRRPVTPQFELRVHLANPNGEFYPGQRAYVRMTVGHLPLLKQWTRRFLQLIDSSNTNEWI